MVLQISEGMLQVYTKDLLDLRKIPSVVAFHVPNETALPVQWVLKLLKEGMLPGVPDWVFLLPGPRTDFLELKRPKQGKSRAGRQSDAQKKFEKAVTALGFKYWLATTPEEIEIALEGIGAIGSRVELRKAA